MTESAGEDVVNGPDMRLAAYGTLAPGRENHGQLSDLPGRWLSGYVHGSLVNDGWGATLGFPALVLDPAGPRVKVFTFESQELPEHWGRLDAFEGSGYQRVPVDVATAEGLLPASIYVLARGPLLSAARGPIDVRSATAHDTEDLADVAARTFALACPPTASPSDISAFIDGHLSPERFGGYLADPLRQVAIARVDGRVGGYTMLIFESPAEDVRSQLSTDSTVELSKLYVDPLHHGGAVARALFADALDRVRVAGRTSVWLGTNQANRRAQRFYEKSGFLRVGTKRFQLGSQWEDDFIYELVL